MKIFKFGGASVKDAEGVKNVASILRRFPSGKIVAVISAMGKTTNNLERVVNAWFNKEGNPQDILDEIRAFHHQVMGGLFKSAAHPVYHEINNFFVSIEWALEDETTRGYDFVYDQVVSAGELISSKIVGAYLEEAGVANSWIDVRDCIQTDNTYREGRVQWDLTSTLAGRTILPALAQDNSLVITQGFIGSTSENYTTTLGREGSDYTAAILAYCLDAEEVIIWKDVPGVLNADPKWFDRTQMLEKVSYSDAIELAYYGASIIHPKTIKPLQNKNIPLRVKSFITPESKGTLISSETQTEPLIPSFIFKMNQVLLSISAKDFSFVAEEHLSRIFGLFAQFRVKINLMQISAISFSVSLDYDTFRLPPLLAELRKEFTVRYNDKLELVTIRHYDHPTVERVTEKKYILVEQRSRTTIQMVMRDADTKA